MMVECIFDRWTTSVEGCPHLFPDWPVVGQSYRVVGRSDSERGSGFLLKEFPGRLYTVKAFRELDDTFGPAVCERIEQQVEYENAQS